MLNGSLQSPPLSPMSSPLSSPLSSPEFPSSDSEFYDFDDFSLDHDESFFTLFIGTPFKRSLQKYKDKIKAQLQSKQDEIKSSVEARKTKLKKKLRQQKTGKRLINTVKLRDKLAFVLGVSSLWFIPCLMLLRPQLIPLYFTVCGVFLIAIRFLLYHSRKWHYFTADLCYVVNVATMLFLYAFPKSRILFAACFCLSNGPVAWAIYAWRNSMVFHSTDKMTSIWIHVMPALVVYTVRWMTPGELTAYPLFSSSAASTDFSFKECMIISTVMYLIWQIGYYYIIMVRKKEKVLNGSRATSFTWMLADHIKNKPNSAVTKFMIYVGPHFQMPTFMFLNFLFALATTAPTFLFYKYYWANTAFLIGVVSMSIFNGADYYIEVFSRRYRQELLMLDASAEQIDESLLEATFGCVGSRGKTFKDIVAEEGAKKDN